MIIDLLLFIASIAEIWIDKKFGTEYPKQRQTALEEFHEYKVSSNNCSLEFDGSKAKIIDEKVDATSTLEKKWGGTSYSFTFFAQNQAGEYFMYVSNPDAAPYFKHISQVNAKIVLGKKYTEPQIQT
jgi:hypothetical protein